MACVIITIIDKLTWHPGFTFWFQKRSSVKSIQIYDSDEQKTCWEKNIMTLFLHFALFFSFFSRLRRCVYFKSQEKLWLNNHWNHSALKSVRPSHKCIIFGPHQNSVNKVTHRQNQLVYKIVKFVKKIRRNIDIAHLEECKRWFCECM